MKISDKRPRTPEEIELEIKQKEVEQLEADLVEKELELATLRAELHRFHHLYMKEVGYLYAILDDIEAQIAEAVARRYPWNKKTIKIAEEAREKAKQSASEFGQSERKNINQNQFKPSESLKALYKAAARAIHPDLAEDETERQYRNKIMAEINDAYENGDEDKIRTILEEWEDSPERVKGEGMGSELIRAVRKIYLLKKRLDIIDQEIKFLNDSPIAKLKKKVEKAKAQGRDLLNEMASNLKKEIEEAKVRLIQIQESYGMK